MALRVMWLLNHTSARKFEILMLKKIGVNQIFLPKIYPSDPSFRSANVDWSEDSSLEISPSDLQLLNSVDWYEGATPEAWAIANKHFDIVFLIVHHPGVLINAARYFNGAILWRAYGLDKSISYGHLVKHFELSGFVRQVKNRFWFGEAYAHLADSEPPLLSDHRVFLPLGLSNISANDNWKGEARHIYFVCPDIGFNDFYRKIYDEFRSNFSTMPYVIAGAQPVPVNDPSVLGYVTNDQHAFNMAQSRVMFYHSQEPNHIHYHPFEAIRAGMPLVFMAGGILDRMGGKDLPGRCKTIGDARKKIKRILADDWDLINQIRISQVVLLDAMKPENCESAWRDGFKRIESSLNAWRAEQAVRPLIINRRRKRIAVILPIAYRGGSLRGAIALAKALYLGSKKSAEDVDVVFLHLDDNVTYSDEDFHELPDAVLRRPFQWKTLSATQACEAMNYAGFQGWKPSATAYIVPDDGMRQLVDCDLWLIVSDRLSHPILPVKPVVLMVYDYLQRYKNVLPMGVDRPFLHAARSAVKVLTTTEFSKQDAMQYAGVDPLKVVRLPILAPEFSIRHTNKLDVSTEQEPYFIWTTNAAPHKNHKNAAEALEIYYEELGGCLSCKVTGVNTDKLLTVEMAHLGPLADIFERSESLQKYVVLMGDLPDHRYRNVLSTARFLWHPGSIDNGTFSVIEAACFGVPALSSDYPAMREIDDQFSLNMAWMISDSPRDMALQLKNMEETASVRRYKLPSEAQLLSQRIENHACLYWREVRECL